MAAHRYWRFVNFATYGYEDLELGEVHLFDRDTRVDHLAEFSCSYAPVSGDENDLSDDLVETTVRWAAAHVVRPNFLLMWDFGGNPVNLTGARFAGPVKERYVERFVVEFSDDGEVWDGGVDCPGVEYLDGELNDVGQYDEHFANVQLLIQGAVRDKSMYGRSVSIPNQLFNDAHLDYRTRLFDLPVVRFDGEGDTLNVAYADGLNLHGDSFTAEGFANSTHGGTRQIMSFGQGSSTKWRVQMNAGNYIEVFDVTAGAVAIRSSGLAPANNATFHWAVDRDHENSITRLFLNGVEVGSADFNPPATPGLEVSFGSATGFSNTFGGWMGGIRITKGVSRYQAGFTAPTEKHYEPIDPITSTTPLYRRARPISGLRRAQIAPAIDAVFAIRTTPRLLAHDGYAGGRGTIIGTTHVKGEPNSPFRCRVRLLRTRDAMLVRETWSEADTGAYVFRDIDESEMYTVIAYDHTGNFRAVVADRLQPELAS